MLNARFKINNGNLNTIDLVEAMRNNSANISGTTHFTVLSGNLLLSNQIYEFKNLTLQDNQLQAYGKIDIMADNKLAGDVYSKILLKSKVEPVFIRGIVGGRAAPELGSDDGPHASGQQQDS